MYFLITCSKTPTYACTDEMYIVLYKYLFLFISCSMYMILLLSHRERYLITSSEYVHTNVYCMCCTCTCIGIARKSLAGQISSTVLHVNRFWTSTKTATRVKSAEKTATRGFSTSSFSFSIFSYTLIGLSVSALSNTYLYSSWKRDEMRCVSFVFSI